MNRPPGGDGRAEFTRTVLRIVLIYAVVAMVFLATTEIFFEVSDGQNREQSLAVRLGFVVLTGAALSPVLWRELRQRRRAELRLDEQTATIAAQRDLRMEMVYRVGQQLASVYDDRDLAVTRASRALAPEFYDRVHIGLVDSESELAALVAEGPRLLPDLRRHPEVVQILNAQPGDVQAVAVVPVVVGETVVAAVLAGNTLGRQRVDDNDVEGLGRVAARLGNTLERIGLYLDAQRSEQRLTAVVEGSPLGIIEVDPSTGCVMRANAAASEVLRRTDGTLAGAALTDHDLDVLHPFLGRVVGGEVVVGEEVPLDRGDALVSYVQVSAAPVGPRGALEAVVMILADTTTRRHLEQQVHQSQRLESLGRLAGGVAHDFNNLLTVILGYTDMVRRRLPEGDENREDLEAVQRAAEQARDITDQLLTVSRRKVVQAESVDPNEAVRSMAQVLRRLVGSDIELLAVTDAVDPVMIDKSQLEQVLLNLVVNARDAMPEGGQLTLVTEKGVMPGGGGAATVIRVFDTGVGMDEDTVAHCFEPFFTTKGGQEGTGLGLSTVYGVVVQAGGEITVESSPGKGTTFEVHLPVADGNRAEAPAASSDAHLARILLVDDEAAVRRLARRGLEERGYSVVELGSGSEALEWLDEGNEVDLLITDVAMPRMRGPEVARLVQERRPGLPVLFISGYAVDPGMHDPTAEQIHFLAKPFEQDQLVRAVRAALGDDAQGDEPDPPAPSSERGSLAQGSKR